MFRDEYYRASKRLHHESSDISSRNESSAVRQGNSTIFMHFLALFIYFFLSIPSSLQTGIVSTVYPQSSFLKQEVFLFENLSKESREPLMHLKAIVIVRPTPENITELQRELQTPKYQEYHICTLFLFLFFSFREAF